MLADSDEDVLAMLGDTDCSTKKIQRDLLSALGYKINQKNSTKKCTDS